MLVAIASTFAFFPEYIEYLGVSANSVPLWVGILAASFNIGECLSAFPCAWLADTFGRRPVLVCSIGLSLVLNLGMGFCKTPPQAFLVIVLAGLMNGNVAVMRTCVAEFVPSEDLQPKAFAFLPTAAGLGTIFGPVVGGSLAHPVERYKNMFGGSRILLVHPFALPVMVSAFIFLVAFIAALLCLRETKNKYDLLPAAVDESHDDNEVGDSIALTKYAEEGRSDSLSSHDDEVMKLRRKSHLQHFKNVAIWINAICGLHSIAFDHMLPVFMHHSDDRQHYQSLIMFSFGLGKGS